MSKSYSEMNLAELTAERDIIESHIRRIVCGDPRVRVSVAATTEYERVQRMSPAITITVLNTPDHPFTPPTQEEIEAMNPIEQQFYLHGTPGLKSWFQD